MTTHALKMTHANAADLRDALTEAGREYFAGLAMLGSETWTTSKQLMMDRLFSLAAMRKHARRLARAIREDLRLRHG